MKFDDFFANMYGKQVAVLGVGVSNMPLIRLLNKYGATVTAYDKKPREGLDDAIWDELFHNNVPAVLGEHYLDHIEADYIFRSPGIRPDHPGITAAVNRGAVLTSEMEVFFQVCPCPIIAITGSDGKTTTTTIIAEMLKAAGKTVHLGGNIGTPLLDKAPDMEPDHIAVVELSSFQLFTMQRSPHIAVITNLSPNHLDVHKDMDEYVAAKEHIFLHQSPDDVLILNKNCPYTPNQAEKAIGKVVFFSPHAPLETGICIADGHICHVENGIKTPLIAIDTIKTPGFHNVENYMAACGALYGMVSPEIMAQIAQSFGGVEHRIEYVRTVDGVTYYNDSIASSPTRTIAGLKSFQQPVILIAGGSDKHIPFDELAAVMMERVKALVLVGDTARAIESALISQEGYDAATLPITICDNLKTAVDICKELGQGGDIVTMSPACASFDKYKNFMERGNLFKKLVNEL